MVLLEPLGSNFCGYLLYIENYEVERKGKEIHVGDFLREYHSLADGG